MLQGVTHPPAERFVIGLACVLGAAAVAAGAPVLWVDAWLGANWSLLVRRRPGTPRPLATRPCASVRREVVISLAIWGALEAAQSQDEYATLVFLALHCGARAWLGSRPLLEPPAEA
jgi:hypothetical protein